MTMQRGSISGYSDRDALTEHQLERLRDRAKFVRLEAIRLIEIAKVGHYTSVFSCAEILAALFYDVMTLRRDEPHWTDRDRFLLGKGHAAVGLFPILTDFGFITREMLDSYTRLGSPLGDHPDMTKVPGIDNIQTSFALKPIVQRTELPLDAGGLGTRS